MDQDAAGDAGQGPTTEDVGNREQPKGDEEAPTREDTGDRRMEGINNINRETGCMSLTLMLMFHSAQ